MKVLIIIKAETNYLIRANVVLKINCLLLLNMISNCSIHDIFILKWIAYIRSLNPILEHIFDKKNIVIDLLSRARCIYEEKMEIQDIKEDNEVEDYIYI